MFGKDMVMTEKPTAQALLAVFGVASTISISLLAADNRVYDSYIKMSEDTSIGENTIESIDPITGVTNYVRYPLASQWENGEPMNENGYYLVPEGIKLSINNSDVKTGYVSWPGKELAIQGIFNISASKNRDRASHIPNLALLPGGEIVLKSVYSTIYGETIDIRGTADNPAIIKFSCTNDDNNNKYYPKMDIAVTGDPDGVLKLTNAGKNPKELNFQRAFRVAGGFTDFYGTVIVDGENTWLRPETTATTFDVGGTLLVTNGANVYVDTVSPTFGSLVMAEGSTLQMAAGKTVTVGRGEFDNATIEFASGSKMVFADSLHISSPVKLKVGGLGGDYKTVLMTVPTGECELRAEDFAIVTEKPQFRYVLAVDVTDEVQTLWIKNLYPSTRDATTGYVVQSTADGGSSSSFTVGSFNQAGNWSDGLAPHPGTNYYTAKLIRDKGAKQSELVFQGDSLTQSSVFRLSSTGKFTINDWRVVPNRMTDISSRPGVLVAGDPGTYTINGNLTVFTTETCPFTLVGSTSKTDDMGHVTARQTYKMNVKIKGDESAAIAAEGAPDYGVGDLKYQAACEFLGDMSEYYGTLYVGKNQTVRLGSWGLVKGTLVVLASSASSATITAASDSGVYVPVKVYKTEVSSTVDVPTGKEIAVLDGIDITGTLTKTGDGMLSVGGTAKTGDNAALVVSGGSLKVVSADAVNGIPVSFAEAAKLVADVSAKGDLKEFGARNTLTETPFASQAETGKIAVSFTGEFDADEAEVVVCTVSATAALPEFKVSGKYTNMKVVSSWWRTNEDGTKSFLVRFVRAGTVVVVR